MALKGTGHHPLMSETAWGTIKGEAERKGQISDRRRSPRGGKLKSLRGPILGLLG